MHMKRFSTFIVTLISLGACHGVHDSAPLEDPVGLAWSCDVMGTVKKDQYVGLTLRFENKNEALQTIEIKSIDLVPKREGTKILSPDEIAVFWKSYKSQYKTEQRMALGVGIFTGFTLSVLTQYPWGIAPIDQAGMDMAVLAGEPDFAVYNRNTPKHMNQPHLRVESFKVGHEDYVDKSILLHITDKNEADKLRICFNKPMSQCISYNIFAKKFDKNFRDTYVCTQDR